MKRIFKPMGAGGGAFVLALASTLSYLFGAGRDLMLAHFFGAGAETDAFNTAFLIPDFIFNLFIAGALSGVLMPVFVSTEQKSKKAGKNLIATFTTVMNLLVIVIAGISFFLTPFLVKNVFDSAIPEQQELIINLTRILLFSPILFGISNTLGSLLVARKRFFSFAISPILYNVGILLGIYFLADTCGIYSAVYGAIFGAFLHMSIRLVDFLDSDLKFHPSFNLKDKNFQQVILLAIPKTIGMIAFQGILWTFNSIGYSLEEGSIAAFSFARNFQSFSVSIFGIALATAIFPFLAEFANSKNKQKFSTRTEKSARQILFLALPASVGLFVLARLVIDVFFGHGDFNEQDAILTTSVLLIISFSIPAESLTHLFSRAFYAHKNTLIPMCGQLLWLVVAILGANIFAEQYGVQAFGYAFAGGAILQIIFLMIAFHFKIGSFPWLHFIRRTGLMLILSLIMGLAVYFSQNLLNNDYLNIMFSVSLGIILYLGFAFVLKMPELDRVRSWFQKR